MIYNKPKQKYETVHEWLLEAIDNDVIDNVVVGKLLKNLNPDVIQNMLQSTMEHDGYFIEIIGKCDSCDESIEVGESWIACQICGGTVHFDCTEEYDGKVICFTCYFKVAPFKLEW